MTAVFLAWRLWYILDFIPQNPSLTITPELDKANRDFMRWVLEIAN